MAKQVHGGKARSHCRECMDTASHEYNISNHTRQEQAKLGQMLIDQRNVLTLYTQLLSSKSTFYKRLVTSFRYLARLLLTARKSNSPCQDTPSKPRSYPVSSRTTGARGSCLWLSPELSTSDS